MLLFLIGLVIGGILGVALICALSIASIADDQMELIIKKSERLSFYQGNIIISRH
jgi:hypothetical protein